MRRNISVVLSSSLPERTVSQSYVQRLEFGDSLHLPDATSISYSTQAPGGFGALSVGVQARDLFGRAYRKFGTLQKDPAIHPLGKVQVRDGAKVLWEGYVSSQSYDGGYSIGFQAIGYYNYLNKGSLRSTDTVSRTAENTINYALTTAMPVIKLASLGNVGNTYQLSELDGRSPAQVIDQISKEGGKDAYELVDWLVWEDQMLYITPRSIPDSADYESDFASGHTVYEEDYDTVRASINVDYKTPADVESETGWSEVDAAFIEKFGHPFRLTIPGGVLTDEQATSVQRRYTAALADSAKRLRAQYDDSFPLLDSYGNPIDHALVRAGSTIKVGDLPIMFILKTSYQVNTNSLSIEAGSEWRSLDALLNHLNRHAESIANQTQPLTGAKLE